MPGLKDLKNRIKGINNMRKVTKAMQMVSAAKMRKAQDAVLSGRSYADLAWKLVNAAIPEGPSASEGLSGIQESGMTQLLQTYPNAKKIGVILLSTNRGMVGSLNTNLQPLIKKLGGELLAEMVVYGKYAKKIATRMSKNIVADFMKVERRVTSEDVYPIAEFISEAYQTGEYQKIVIVYNHFVSTLAQKPTVKQLLPFQQSSDVVQATGLPSKNAEQKQADGLHYSSAQTDYLFEPTPAKVLEHLLPRIIESQLYETILESDASEHSARMVMMKNATEAAGDLIADYTLTYNQLRQGKITTELSEITAGRIALE